MRRRSPLLRLEPGREIVERDAQSGSEFGERAEVAGLAPGFDLAQVARRNPRGGGERLAGEAAMGAPNADRMLAGAEAPDQLDRQMVGARLLLAEMSYGSSWVAIWAFTLAPIALVSALRETSTVFAVIIGVVFLHERLSLARLASIATTLIGTTVLKLSR